MLGETRIKGDLAIRVKCKGAGLFCQEKMNLSLRNILSPAELQVLMDDGSQAEFGPGEVSLLPPGHDAWVVGNDPVVVIDITGMVEYAQPHAH